jgi:hypothetical protein
MPARTHRASVLSVVLPLIALGGIGSVLVLSTRDLVNARESVPAVSTPAAKPETAEMAATRKRLIDLQSTDTMLRRVGLTPQTLAAANLSDAEVDAIIAGMLAHVSTLDHASLISQATAAYNRSVNTDPRSQRRAGRNGTDPAPAPAGPTTAQLRAALNNLLDAARAQALTGLQADRVEMLEAMRRNADWGVPTEFKAVDRTDQEWIALRAALVAKQHAESRGLTLDNRIASLISTAESNAVVANARSAIAAREQAIKDLWRTRLTPPAVDPSPAPGPR